MAEDFGAVQMCRLAEYNEKGVETRKIDLNEENKMWQHPWMLVHRVKLHDRLKSVATGPEGIGKPAKLHLSSKVVEVDPETATLVLEKGDRVQADVIIGADGIYVRCLEHWNILLLTTNNSRRPGSMSRECQASSSVLEKLLFGSWSIGNPPVKMRRPQSCSKMTTNWLSGTDLIDGLSCIPVTIMIY